VERLGFGSPSKVLHVLRPPTSNAIEVLKLADPQL
jgi:hypothetical protein